MFVLKQPSTFCSRGRTHADGDNNVELRPYVIIVREGTNRVQTVSTPLSVVVTARNDAFETGKLNLGEIQERACEMALKCSLSLPLSSYSLFLFSYFSIFSFLFSQFIAEFELV